jgi:hypothetical protein
MAYASQHYAALVAGGLTVDVALGRRFPGAPPPALVSNESIGVNRSHLYGYHPVTVMPWTHSDPMNTASCPLEQEIIRHRDGARQLYKNEAGNPLRHVVVIVGNSFGLWCFEQTPGGMLGCWCL